MATVIIATDKHYEDSNGYDLEVGKVYNITVEGPGGGTVLSFTSALKEIYYEYEDENGVMTKHESPSENPPSSVATWQVNFEFENGAWLGEPIEESWNSFEIKESKNEALIVCTHPDMVSRWSDTSDTLYDVCLDCGFKKLADIDQ